MDSAVANNLQERCGVSSLQPPDGKYKSKGRAKLADKATKEHSNCGSLAEPVQLRAVLHDKYYRPLETVNVLACQINDKKETSRLLREINEIYDLKELKHLKRIRNGSGQLKVIITEAREDFPSNAATLKELFRGTSVDTKGLSEPSVMQVPRNPPLTRQQYEEWSKKWPTSFHENKHIAKLINDEIFNDEELEEMRDYMRHAIEAALIGKKEGMPPVGAVIVDPKTKEILCKAHDLSLEHSLQHAAMVCIDLVARLQGGGVWDIDAGFSAEGSSVVDDNKMESCTVFEETRAQSCFNRDIGNRVTDDHDMSCANNLNVYWDEDTLSCSRTNKTESDNETTSICLGMADRSGCNNSGPYLCTGYDLYITREPCVMCSMALLHSRIRRVFYAQEFTAFGGLGSKYKIHCLEGTNHHFEVFSGLLETECRHLL